MRIETIDGRVYINGEDVGVIRDTLINWPWLEAEHLSKYGDVLEVEPPQYNDLTQRLERRPPQPNERGVYVERWAVVDMLSQAEAAAALVARYDAAVQTRLDAVARGFGYGDPNRPDASAILCAVSYADEAAVPRFQVEGRALRAWRSRTWLAAARILADVQAKKRPVPTEGELMDELERDAPAPTPTPFTP